MGSRISVPSACREPSQHRATPPKPREPRSQPRDKAKHIPGRVLMSLRCFRQWLLVCVALLCVPAMAIGQSAPHVLFGFTAFPYDLTSEAIEKVHQIILPQSNLYA